MGVGVCMWGGGVVRVWVLCGVEVNVHTYVYACACVCMNSLIVLQFLVVTWAASACCIKRGTQQEWSCMTHREMKHASGPAPQRTTIHCLDGGSQVLGKVWRGWHVVLLQVLTFRELLISTVWPCCNFHINTLCGNTLQCLARELMPKVVK